MEHNVGMQDRYIRIAAGGLLLAAGAGYLARRSTAAGMLLGLLGGTMLAEGVLGTCPLYSVYGVDTRTPEELAAEPPPGERTNDLIEAYSGI